MASKILLKDGKVLIDADKKVLMQEEERSLKKLLDTRGSAAYLFYKYQGTSADDLIKYDDTENVTNMSNMFYFCSYITTIPQLNTNKVTNMGSMFSYCSGLVSIPQLNASNVISMSSMFANCTKLTTIPQLDTSNVTNMSAMFFYCNELVSIPQLDTSKVTYMGNMFYDCYKLQTIDITSMDNITSSSNSSNMCANCRSLTKLIIRTMTVIPALNSNAFTQCYHFLGTVDATYNPEGLKDGRIYVPDNMVDSLKSATNWSTYADIIVPLSTLEE